MFNVCYECDGKLSSEVGTVYGYWGDEKKEFVDLPMHRCDNCGVVYLDECIAVLTQEITRALSDINYNSKLVDVSGSYNELVEHLDDIYEIIAKNRIKLICVNDKIIINHKDVTSVFNDSNILFAARNEDELTEDVIREINGIKKQQ